MIVGRLIQEAATELRDRAKREPLPLRVEKTYVQPDSIHGMGDYRGDAYPCTRGRARSWMWTST